MVKPIFDQIYLKDVLFIAINYHFDSNEVSLTFQLKKFGILLKIYTQLFF